MRYDTAAPPTTLFVATATGIEILERDAPGAAWQRRRTALQTRHVSTMTCLPGRAELFAGTHGDGIYCSEDNGLTWKPRG
jgi:hypothetical protein